MKFYIFFILSFYLFSIECDLEVLTKVEKAICGNDELLKLHEKLDEDYYESMDILSKEDQEKLLLLQKEWLWEIGFRARSFYDDDFLDTLLISLYKDRINIINFSKINNYLKSIYLFQNQIIHPALFYLDKKYEDKKIKDEELESYDYNNIFEVNKAFSKTLFHILNDKILSYQKEINYSFYDGNEFIERSKDYYNKEAYFSYEYKGELKDSYKLFLLSNNFFYGKDVKNKIIYQKTLVALKFNEISEKENKKIEEEKALMNKEIDKNKSGELLDYITIFKTTEDLSFKKVKDNIEIYIKYEKSYLDLIKEINQYINKIKGDFEIDSLFLKEKNYVNIIKKNSYKIENTKLVNINTNMYYINETIKDYSVFDKKLFDTLKSTKMVYNDTSYLLLPKYNETIQKAIKDIINAIIKSNENKEIKKNVSTIVKKEEKENKFIKNIEIPSIQEIENIEEYIDESELD